MKAAEHNALRQKLKTRQRVEFTMAILEDFPELVIDIVFAVGLKDTNEALSFADIALFMLGAVLSSVPHWQMPLDVRQVPVNPGGRQGDVR